jgi:hypothetical protein
MKRYFLLSGTKTKKKTKNKKKKQPAFLLQNIFKLHIQT